MVLLIFSSSNRIKFESFFSRVMICSNHASNPEISFDSMFESRSVESSESVQFTFLNARLKVGAWTGMVGVRVPALIGLRLSLALVFALARVRSMHRAVSMDWWTYQWLAAVRATLALVWLGPRDPPRLPLACSKLEQPIFLPDVPFSLRFATRLVSWRPLDFQ